MLSKVITSKQIIQLSEKYLTAGSASGQGPSTYISIYENPTTSDFIEMQKLAKLNNRNLSEARFIADARNQKVYIADGYLCTHRDIEKLIGVNRDSGFWNFPKLFDGIALVSSGRATMKTWDKWNYGFKKDPFDTEYYWWLDEIFNHINWSFVDRFISGFTLMIRGYKVKYENWQKNKYSRL